MLLLKRKYSENKKEFLEIKNKNSSKFRAHTYKKPGSKKSRALYHKAVVTKIAWY